MFSLSKNPLRALERRIGRRFRRRELLERALTHRSYANEKELGSNYERLEFLGDTVLGLATADWLFFEHPEVSEGQLSAHKSRLVSEPILAEFARELGLGEFVRLGVGEERSGGRNKDSIPGKVERLEYDPNRSAHIALILYADGERRYILAPKGVRPGDQVMSGREAPIKPGNALPIRNIPVTIQKVSVTP